MYRATPSSPIFKAPCPITPLNKLPPAFSTSCQLASLIFDSYNSWPPIQTKQYQKIRDTSIRLTQTIFDWGGNKFQHMPAAQKLDLWYEEGLAVENDSEMECFMEYLMYYGKHQGQLILDQFFDSDIALSDTEENLNTSSSASIFPF